ncbi:sulfite exporter TauE/SafE family protein [Georgenia subflava]
MLVGLSKTALPGAATISVALFAAVLPARESTGALLVLLILGDLFAVRIYRAHADWPTLRRLVPTVLAGVLVGTAFLALVGDEGVRRTIGLILLVLVAVTLVRARWGRSPRQHRGSGEGGTAGSGADDVLATGGTDGSGVGNSSVGESGVGSKSDDGGADPRRWGRRLETGTYGVLGGFTTMVANAGGPVMSLYFLASRFSMKQFLGTAAWFFLAVNLAKTPFSVGLGLIDGQSLLTDLVLAPAVVVGALAGRSLAKHVNQRLFERLVLVLTIVSAVYLLLP